MVSGSLSRARVISSSVFWLTLSSSAAARRSARARQSNLHLLLHGDFHLLLFMRSAAYHTGQSPWENNKRR